MIPWSPETRTFTHLKLPPPRSVTDATGSIVPTGSIPAFYFVEHVDLLVKVLCTAKNLKVQAIQKAVLLAMFHLQYVARNNLEHINLQMRHHS